MNTTANKTIALAAPAPRKGTQKIKTRLASAAAASLFGLAAIAGTVLTCAAPANASSAAPSTQIAQQEPAGPGTEQQEPTGPQAGQPFSGDPYPESNPFPSLPGNPWK